MPGILLRPALPASDREVIHAYFEDLQWGVLLHASTVSEQWCRIELVVTPAEICVHKEPPTYSSFTIRPGYATINGEAHVGWVGFCQKTGRILILDQDRAFVKCSSPIANVVQLENVIW